MAPRAGLDRVMWSSLTTSQARATRRARWEFRADDRTAVRKDLHPYVGEFVWTQEDN
jgi:hypothetical protein